MSEVTALIEAHPASETPRHFRFECAGGTVGVTTATERLTPYGGAAAWSHYLEKQGVVADLARQFSATPHQPQRDPGGRYIAGLHV